MKTKKKKKPTATIAAASARLATLENAEIEYMIILGFFSVGNEPASGERVITALEHFGIAYDKNVAAVFAGLVGDGTLVHCGVEDKTGFNEWKLSPPIRAALVKNRAKVERYLQRRLIARS